MCRRSYDIQDARRIRIHSIVSANIPPTPIPHTSDDLDHQDDPVSEEEDESSDEADDLDERAQHLLDQITAVTLGGDRPASEVHDLIERARDWLSRQPENEVCFTWTAGSYPCLFFT